MKTFDYTRAESADHAVALLGRDPDARILAGGTNLVDLMKLGVEQPGSLVDVTRLPLDDITEQPGGGLRIGAGVRNSDLAAHPQVRQRYPVLAEAVDNGASGQIRNMATTAGNLLQRTRCRYFQDVAMPCNKRHPGSGCPAIDGEHRNLAIIGASEHCVATHPSDMAVALAALDTTVIILGPDGQRRLPIEELYLPPGDTPHREYALARDEIILAVEIPNVPGEPRSTYRKVRERASYAFALASCAAVLTMAGPEIADVRLAFGGIAPKPWRAHRAESWLRGRSPDPDTIVAAVDRELADARPLRDNAYKIPLLRGLTVATITELAEDPS